MNKELLENFLHFHVKKLINDEKGYLLTREKYLNFTMFMNFQDSELEQEYGIVHEAGHFIYRTQGSGVVYPIKNEDGTLTEGGKIEVSIENEAQRFVNKNKGLTLQLINKYFEI